MLYASKLDLSFLISHSILTKSHIVGLAVGFLNLCYTILLVILA